VEGGKEVKDGGPTKGQGMSRRRVSKKYPECGQKKRRANGGPEKRQGGGGRIPLESGSMENQFEVYIRGKVGGKAMPKEHGGKKKSVVLTKNQKPGRKKKFQRLDFSKHLGKKSFSRVVEKCLAEF